LLGRAGKWLAVLVVASLMVPALTTQWSDRQKELDLKTSLVSQLTSSAAIATQDAFTLVGDEAKSPTIKDAAWRTEYRSILKEWRVAAFTLMSELGAYFPDVKSTTKPGQDLLLVDAFSEYNNAVQQYIRLSLDECSKNTSRQKVIGELYSYLALSLSNGIKKYPVGTGSGQKCWKKPERFRKAYQRLGDELLTRRDPLVDVVIHSNAAGYNVGFKDFVHQLLPFY
jgi:hypothetical protein